MSLVSPPSEPKLMTVPVPFGQQIRDIAQQTPSNAIDRDVDRGALGGGPDAVLPGRKFRRENGGARQDRGEPRCAGFGSDQADDLHATLRQNLGGKAPDCGSCSSQQHDDPGARVRGKGVVCCAYHCECRERVDQPLRADFVRNRVRHATVIAEREAGLLLFQLSSAHVTVSTTALER